MATPKKNYGTYIARCYLLLYWLTYEHAIIWDNAAFLCFFDFFRVRRILRVFSRQPCWVSYFSSRQCDGRRKTCFICFVSQVIVTVFVHVVQVQVQVRVMRMDVIFVGYPVFMLFYFFRQTLRTGFVGHYTLAIQEVLCVERGGRMGRCLLYTSPSPRD